jgi:GalNAc-alpha-(1->4)-GalNAc-alpha-(1->3)-diNAcBac-PP-undecaprenol alpha-1,4-N-acetyl-D-galactosaminyltransferase
LWIKSGLLGAGTGWKRKLHKHAVALYFHRLGGCGGGAQRVLCLLANALLARDFIVHLVSWDDHLAKAFYPLSPGVVWHRLGFHPGFADKLRRAREVARVLRQHNIPVLVGFVVSGDKSIVAAAKLAAAKVIAAERNSPAIYHIRYGRIERCISLACLYATDQIVIQFPSFIRGYPASLHHRIEVIPNPVPVASVRALPQQPGPGGRFTLLAVSRLDRVQKRLHTLIDAFTLIADCHPAWDLLVVGNGPEEAALRRQIVASGISARIRLEPSTQSIFQVYAKSHLFASPSRWEGFSNALAEALAHGLPAVGFRDAPGVGELITDRHTGWLADGSDDKEKLAEVLDQAMANDAERSRRGANAIRSMARYDPELQFDRWANLIRSACEA